MNKPFQTIHSGKCDTCREFKTLDSMVMKDYIKGKYECVDCRTEKDNQPFARNDLFYWMGERTQLSRFQKLLGWLTG